MVKNISMKLSINPISNHIIALNQLLIERDNLLVLKEKTIDAKDKKITLLEQTIAHLQLKYFGRSSERHAAQEQLSCFNEAEQIEETAAVADESSKTTEEVSSKKKALAKQKQQHLTTLATTQPKEKIRPHQFSCRMAARKSIPPTCRARKALFMRLHAYRNR